MWRENDDMWAVLAWLSILAHYNSDLEAPLVHVETIVKQHWEIHGRNFLVRHDYEGVDKSTADAVMSSLLESISSLHGHTYLDGRYEVAKAEEFEHVDPIDGPVFSHRGIRLLFAGGSRIIFRLSNNTAGSSGEVTICMYVEKYESDPSLLFVSTRDSLEELVGIGLRVSRMEELTGMAAPTVIT